MTNAGKATSWGGSTGQARPVAQAVPCRDCGHHPGDHKGNSGEGHCTLCRSCDGYRWTGPGITVPAWTDPDWWPR